MSTVQVNIDSQHIIVTFKSAYQGPIPEEKK